MRSSFLVCVVGLLAIIPSQILVAQGPEFSVPNVVVKDADGKTIGQVESVTFVGSDLMTMMFLEINGSTVLVRVTPKFLSVWQNQRVEFSGADCTGDIYMKWGATFGFNGEFSKTVTAIVGPDGDTGEYRVFQTVSEIEEPVTISSYRLSSGGCGNYGEPKEGNYLPAEELFPNPLSGFHGPTTANPERVLTIKGGTRLP